MTGISIFGSTGSIGRNALLIAGKYPALFNVVALSAGYNMSLLKRQIKDYSPEYVCVIEERDALALKKEFKRVEVLWGQNGLRELSNIKNTDMIIMAIAGLDALMPTYLALKSGLTVALASKEVMVAAGRLISRVKDSGKLLIPVDSEHSAIYQLIRNEKLNTLKRIILTASGGPLLNTDQKKLKYITVEKALKHPTWKMGRKITIDSATMMNKGLEMIEARWLFKLKPEQIDVVIHPQSIIHSMVEFADGAVLAHLGVHDMRLPIAYAMNEKKRMPVGVSRLDFVKLGALNFMQPDLKKFGCLRIATDVLRADDSSAIVMNAADEVAVDAFLKRKITFTDIPKIIEHAIARYNYNGVRSINDVIEADREVKKYLYERIK